MPTMSLEDRLALALGRLLIASESKTVQIEELTAKVSAMETANVSTDQQSKQ